MQYQIEKGIEMPALQPLRRSKTPLRLAFEQMEVGDSVVIECDHVARAHAGAKAAGIKVSARRLPDGTARVWRVA